MTDPKQKQKKSAPKGSLNQYARYSALGFQMIAAVLGGALFGQWLDGKQGWETPWFTILFSLLGIAIALYSLFRQLPS